MATIAYNIWHRRVCMKCRQIGDIRTMLRLKDGLWHDRCVTATFSANEILKLPAAERAKISVEAAGLPLIRKLRAVSAFELVVNTPNR